MLVLRFRYGNEIIIKTMQSIQCYYASKMIIEVKFNVKTILVCFINAKGILLTWFSPRSQIAYNTFHFAFLKCFPRRCENKTLDLWQNKEWCTSHWKSYWRKLAWSRLRTFPIHPTKLPVTVSLFLLTMRRALRRNRFASVEKMKVKPTLALKHFNVLTPASVLPL